MNVKITIECETGVQIVQHLYALIRETKKELRKIAKKPNQKIKGLVLYDNNCYGTHEAIVKGIHIENLIDGVPLKKKKS